ncbi:MAG: U32 family peptidase, partial [Bacilli bacterium]|nr:U32 family peptidase [Bacilli bacterium]
MELLAPAGSFEVLKMAIAGGADAVYLAGKNFGARAYADNFSYEELTCAIKFSHLYGVKVHVTVNTLIFEDELDSVINYIKFLYENDCDAVIVQDLGLASIIHKNFPDLELHASTQINAQTLEDVKVLKELGFSRVIMGREVSVDELKRIKESGLDIEIEVFVHGALCMSYSGNCLFSSFEGGRSGNRGRCAQPCRKSYNFLGKKGFFLSPKDLCTIDNIKEISQYVDSMKIEGRMKSGSYVYEVVKSYKQKLFNSNLDTTTLKRNMQIAFNRGYTKGFILKENNRDFTNINSSNHQGVLVGEVLDSFNNKTSIRLSQDLYDGDSLRIVSRDNKKEDSVIINGMYVNGSVVKYARSGSVVTIRCHEVMKEKDLVYLTKREITKYELPKIDITARVSNNDKELILSFSDGKNTVKGSIFYEDATSDLNERIITQIKKTGETVFTVKEVISNLTKQVYVNIKELNDLRRSLLNELSLLREKSYDRKKVSNIIYPYLDFKKSSTIDNPSYSVVVSNKESLEIVKDYLNKNNKDYNFYTRFNSSEYHYLPRANARSESNRCVSSNLGAKGKISSVYFNVTNSATVRVMEYLGYEKVGLSVELAKKDIRKLVLGYINRYNDKEELERQLKLCIEGFKKEYENMEICSK